jgi:hypothetical protein
MASSQQARALRSEDRLDVATAPERGDRSRQPLPALAGAWAARREALVRLARHIATWLAWQTRPPR